MFVYLEILVYWVYEWYDFLFTVLQIVYETSLATHR